MKNYYSKIFDQIGPGKNPHGEKPVKREFISSDKNSANEITINLSLFRLGKRAKQMRNKLLPWLVRTHVQQNEL